MLSENLFLNSKIYTEINSELYKNYGRTTERMRGVKILRLLYFKMQTIIRNEVQFQSIIRGIIMLVEIVETKGKQKLSNLIKAVWKISNVIESTKTFE